MKPTQAVCKFVCTARKHGETGTTPTIYMQARYDHTLPADQLFHAATPWGELTFGLSNPHLEEFFQPGLAYHITITRA